MRCTQNLKYMLITLKRGPSQTEQTAARVPAWQGCCKTFQTDQGCSNEPDLAIVWYVDDHIPIVLYVALKL